MPSKLAFVSPLALSLFAGSCFGQVVTWDGLAGPNWFDSFQSGNCPNTQLQYFNGFGQIGCGGPVFPGPSNSVIVNAGTGPNINGSFTIGGMSIASGGSTTWSFGDVNFGTSPGLTNSGLFLLTTANNRSVYGSTITNNGEFRHSSPGILYFQTLALINNDLVAIERGNWANWTGTNSFVNNGDIEKTSADEFSTNVASQFNGVLDVQEGTFNLQGTSAVFGPASTTFVRNNALLSLQSQTVAGNLNASISGSGVLRANGHMGQSAPFVTNVFGGSGFSWLNGDWTAGGNALTNTGLFTLASANNRSFYGGSLVNSNTFVAFSPAILYFQTLAFSNPGILHLYTGTWQNHTGVNSISSTGQIFKHGPDVFSTNVPTNLGGQVSVNEGTLQFNSASVEFQNPATSIAANAVFNLNNCGLMGTFAPTLGAGATLSLFGQTSQTGPLTLNATGAKGADWTGGDWSANGQTLTNLGLLTISQAANRSIYSATVNNNGTLVFTPDVLLYFQTCAMQNFGTIEWQRGRWQNHTGTNSLTSTGTLKKTSADLFTMHVPSTVSGPVQVQGGTLRWQSTSLALMPTSAFTLSSGTSLSLENCTLQGKLTGGAANASVTMHSTTALGGAFISNVSGGSGLQYTGSDLYLNGFNFSNTGLFTLTTDANRSIFSGSLSNSGTFDSSAAAVLYFQTLAFNNSGTLKWRKGNWANHTGTNSLVNSGLIEKIDATDFSSSVPLTHSGTFHVKGGTATIFSTSFTPSASSFTDTAFGTTLALNNCTLRGDFPGSSGAPGTMVLNTFTLGDDFTANISGIDGLRWASGEGHFGGHTLTNNGVFSIMGGNRSQFGATLVNNGVLSIDVNDTLYFQTATWQNEGTVNWTAGNLLNWSGTNSIINNAYFDKVGETSASCTVPFTNNGTFAMTRGTANLSGFTQDPAATIRPTIYSPTESGRLNLSTPITLHGDLAVYFDALFAPSVGQSWTVLSAPTVNGTFDNVVPIAFPAGRQIAVTYVPVGAPTQVVVTVLESGCVADLNHDNVVDDADFVLFVPAYNILDCNDPTMPAGCPADFNGDGLVDDIDFQLFVYAYDILLCPE